jgi:hypothetical protein
MVIRPMVLHEPFTATREQKKLVDKIKRKDRQRGTMILRIVDLWTVMYRPFTHSYSLSPPLPAKFEVLPPEQSTL